MPAPAIYANLNFPPEVPLRGRLLAVLLAGMALTVLLVAAHLVPDGRGYGTHEGLGMAPCGFYQQYGIPCAGCGMTTSFAYAVRGRLIAAFIAQPFGLILCLGTAAAFWSAIYVAATGRPAYLLLRFVPGRVHAVLWPSLTLAAWAWKIALSAGH